MRVVCIWQGVRRGVRVRGVASYSTAKNNRDLKIFIAESEGGPSGETIAEGGHVA